MIINEKKSEYMFGFWCNKCDQYEIELSLNPNKKSVKLKCTGGHNAINSIERKALFVSFKHVLSKAATHNYYLTCKGSMY